jgi:hypothetical protein
MHQPRHHRVNDQREQHKAEDEKEIAERRRRLLEHCDQRKSDETPTIEADN